MEFIVNVFTLPVYYSNPNSMKNSTRAWIMLQLKKLQLAKKINLVSVCNDRRIAPNFVSFYRATQFYAVDTVYKIDQNVHRDLLDAIRNPTYKRFMDYQDLKCSNQNSISIYIWNKKVFSGEVGSTYKLKSIKANIRT